jgi:hypothetical protein
MVREPFAVIAITFRPLGVAPLEREDPSSPARCAVGSGTPRAIRAVVMAAARPTLLRASRSWSSVPAATGAWRLLDDLENIEA